MYTCWVNDLFGTIKDGLVDRETFVDSLFRSPLFRAITELDPALNCDCVGSIVFFCQRYGDGSNKCACIQRTTSKDAQVCGVILKVLFHRWHRKTCWSRFA